MNVCADTSSSWARGLWGTTLTSSYSFNGLWHIFSCIGSSVFKLWVIPEAGWLLIVVKARPRVLQLEVITSRELSILHPSICRLLIRKYECLDVETFTIHYYSESRVDVLYHMHSFVVGDSLGTSVPIFCRDTLFMCFGFAYILHPFDNEIHNLLWLSSTLLWRKAAVTTFWWMETVSCVYLYYAKSRVTIKFIFC